ncbi:hypothetical protein KSP39_PZI007335 [Platanthera zijinensis]|uniref:Uncharacterized protein n=1 Tax=Platanthera zijinensis TaxID=2320716 RepID=A0AAP0BQD6_9ASPA
MGMLEAVINGLLPKSVPIFRELVTASTQPNQLFVHPAMSHGLTSNDTRNLVTEIPQKTIFASLNKE